MQRVDTLDRPRFVRPMPDFSAQLNHDGEVIDKKSPDALDWHAYFTEEIHGNEGETPVSYTFEPKPGWKMGREESQHEAFFGVVTTVMADGARRATSVCVKEYPFPVAHLAINEQGMLQDLRDRGLPAVKPVGLVVNRWNMDPGVFVLTEMEPNLESLNAQDWSQVEPGEVHERIAPVIDTLVMLQGEGVFPHELAFGNVAVGEAEGSRYIFDLESAKSFRNIMDNIGSDDPIPDELFIAFRSDFTPPRVSLRDFVFKNAPDGETPTTPEEAFQTDLNLIYEPYHMAILESSSPYKPILLRMYHTMLEHARLEVASGEYSRGMYKFSAPPQAS